MLALFCLTNTPLAFRSHQDSLIGSLFSFWRLFSVSMCLVSIFALCDRAESPPLPSILYQYRLLASNTSGTLPWRISTRSSSYLQPRRAESPSCGGNKPGVTPEPHWAVKPVLWNISSTERCNLDSLPLFLSKSRLNFMGRRAFKILHGIDTHRQAR